MPTCSEGSSSAESAERGFRFVGPTTLYATLQAIGAVDDHIHGCWLAKDRVAQTAP